MSFNILAVRTAESDDATMFPVLGDERNEIEFDPLDGPNPSIVVATGLHVYDPTGPRLRTVTGVKDIKANVYITDARVAVACSKYDKGGGWMGTSLSVVPLNLASHARAAIRRHGKMLVGHVRYPWLSKVGFSPKTGWASSERVQLVLTDATGTAPRPLVLELTLPKDVDSGEVARVIAERAARYRLAHDVALTTDERASFEALLSPPRLSPDAKAFDFYVMPNSYNATPATAYPKTLDG